MYFIGGKDVKVDFYSTVDLWLDGSVVYVRYVSCLPASVHPYVSVSDCVSVFGLITVY